MTTRPIFSYDPVRPDAEGGDSSNSWGRVETIDAAINGSDKTAVELVRVTFQDSLPLRLVVDIDDNIFPNAPSVASHNNEVLTTWVGVEYSAGAAFFRRFYPVGNHIEIPLTASYVRAFVFIGVPIGSGNVVDTTPFASPAQSRVSMFLARGETGTPQTPYAIQNDEINGVTPVVSEPCTILAFTAHLVALPGAPLFLQIFDKPVAPGVEPTEEYLLSDGISLKEIDHRYLNGRTFAYQFIVAISSTSGSFTANAALGWIHYEQFGPN